MQSDLFLVKQFFILREQLSPFDMGLRSVERQLDFSDAGKAVNLGARVMTADTFNLALTFSERVLLRARNSSFICTTNS
jgi:hypothetical protein